MNHPVSQADNDQTHAAQQIESSTQPQISNFNDLSNGINADPLELEPEAQTNAAPITKEHSQSIAGSVSANETRDSNALRRRARNGRMRAADSSAVVPTMPPKDVHRILLMSASEQGEVRVAILEDGRLTEIYLERKSHRQLTGNVFKGRVVNIEPALQAAFIDIGMERNGFLHASDCLHPKNKDEHTPEEDRRPPKRSEVKQLNETPSLPTVPPVSAQPPVALATEANTANENSGNENNDGSRRRGRRRRGRGRGRSRRGRIPNSPVPMLKPEDSVIAGQLVPDANLTVDLSEPEAEHPETELVALESYEEPVDSSPLDEDEVLDSSIIQASSMFGACEEDAADKKPATMAGISEPSLELNVQQQAASNLSLEQHNDESISNVPEHDFSCSESKVDAEASQSSVASNVQAQPKPNFRKRPIERRLTIQEMLTKGQEIIVQVAKEGMGQKGPALTTYLSIPGRYLVLMPSVNRLGVSKRIESDTRRQELKAILNELNIPEGMGVIARTAAMGKSKEELQNDLDCLMQLWEQTVKQASSVKAPALLIEEGDVITRVFRDVLTENVAEIVVDNPIAVERARAYLMEQSPGEEIKVKLYCDSDPLFHKFQVESQLQRLFDRKVPLKSGGSIVIEQTEALVAIDVNTGRCREKQNQDEAILQTNLEAAREIARQLRLRDIGGLIMIDFIDMEIMEHRRKVEREMKMYLARDKARINVYPISALGIMEMSRQRIRHSLRKTFFERCPYCNGTGQVKSSESLGLDMVREIRFLVSKEKSKKWRVSLNPAVAFAILNDSKKEIAKLEDECAVSVEIRGDSTMPMSQFKIFHQKSSGDWVLRSVSEVDEYVRNS